jgi:hypothetical protein
MGKTNGAINSGRVGNVIYYTYRGKPCCRSVPSHVRQTTATKQRATEFGVAVRLSYLVRKYFKSILPDEKDKRMLYGLNNAALQWFRTSNLNEDTFTTNNFFIDQFQFNAEALLPALVKRQVITDFSQPNGIAVLIPGLMPGKDIVAPAGTKNIYWQIGVTKVRINFKEFRCSVGTTKDMLKKVIEIPYSDQPLPAQQITFPYRLSKSALTVVALCLRYETEVKGKLQMVTDKRWLPGSIIGSCFGSGGSMSLK